MRFIYLVASIAMLLSFVVGGTYLYVSSNPSPNRLEAFGFDVCNRNPCFLGITPGHTLWNKVSPILQRFNVQRNQLAFHINLNESVSAQIAGNSALYVQLITITNYAASRLENFPSVGEFLQKYGRPCLVEINQPIMRLIYPSMSVTMNIHHHLTPFSPVVQVIQLNSADLNPCLVGQTPDHNLKWLGFASMNRYTSSVINP